MKRSIKFTYLLALWITALFVAGMMMTFINDWIQESGFFGDTVCTHNHAYGVGTGAIDRVYHWGARHYWYFWLCIILFLLSVVRIFIWASYFLENDDKQ